MVRKKLTISPVYPLAAFGLGVFYLATAFPTSLSALVMILAIALAMASFFSALSAALAITPDASRMRARAAKTAFFASVGITAGLCCQLPLLSARSPLRTLCPSNEIISISAKLISDPIPFGMDRYLAKCRVVACESSKGARFSASGLCSVVIPAETVRASLPGYITGSRAPALLSSGLGTAFDGRFLPYDGIFGECFYATSARALKKGIAVTDDPLASQRAVLRLSLARVLYDWGASGGFLFALLTGNRDYLSPRLENGFKRTGLTHILALSGTHLSLVALIACRVGKRAGGKKGAIRLSIVAMLFFVWFAGVSPSLSRSLLMACALTILGAAGIPVSVLPVLAFSAFAQMLANPGDALSLGFALSYGALVGIITVGERLRLCMRKYVPDRISSELSSSIGAQILTSPILAFSVGCVAPIGIIASCLVSLPSSLYIAIGMSLAFIAAAFPPASALCGRCLTAVYAPIESTVMFFAGPDPLSIPGLPGKIAMTCVCLLFFALVMCFTRRLADRRTQYGRFARL
ncbi:MAG TPA: ComEC/Rec2 family competence protein [Treponemataceae bacterium]|nr:ComEC/Rec2 family competence protein [Treponemataceae bacterium]